MMRIKIVAGNWKMNFGPAEACTFFESLVEQLKAGPKAASAERVIFPVAYALSSEIQWVAAKANVKLGAQNVHWADSGAFTGELSAKALKSIGVEWALIGHSERRQFFGETNESAKQRLEHALKTGLRVIFCIGETLAEREAGQTEKVLAAQLESYIHALAKFVAEKQPQDFLPRHAAIAYEPVWAIGTGKTATTEQAQAAHAFIRGELKSKIGGHFAEQACILYGGSVTPDNAAILMKAPDIDGVLVGGASLKPDGFAKILIAGA